MTNKTITLSREVGEMILRNRDRLGSGIIDPVRAALADPVPPAGGKPDPIIAVLKGHLADGMNPMFSGGDIKHLIGLLEAGTRLQAEVERLVSYTPTPENTNRLPEGIRQYVSSLQTLCDSSGVVAENTLLRDQTKQLDAMIGRLKSELTKALELLQNCTDCVRNGEDFDLPVTTMASIDAFRANQSAPADKGQGEPVGLQHMAVAEDGKLRWMSGRKMQNCELYALPDGSAIRFPLYAERPAPVAVVMPFDFEHPLSKERRTVTLTKRDVFDGMEDYFYDKLSEQICQCESVGETNVVDCNCDEYVHDFEIVEACLEEVGRLNSEPKP